MLIMHIARVANYCDVLTLTDDNLIFIQHIVAERKEKTRQKE